MLQLGNSITQWLSVAPSDLFLYAFLPPLIVEQAIHIEFYMFRKMFMHSIMLAVVMVILTAIILTPLILFVLGFQYNGWTWVHGALFAAIIAPTDALAVSSILKKAHGPAILTTILEGESLLNDATGITLFQVFEGILDRNRDQYSNAIPTVWSVIPTIIVDIIKLSAIGVGIGLGFSIISLYILRWLRWRGAGLHIEAVYVLAMAYLTYYVTNAPAGEDISDVDDDSLEKGTSETVELDQNSLWSVMLVLGRALWNSLKKFLVDVFRVLLCSPRSKGCESQDSQDSSSQQWGSSDESTPAFETLLTECPFQSEQIIDEKNSSFIITQGSSDIETGSAKYGLEQTTMSSIQYTDGGGIDDKESDFDQVCLAGSRRDDLLNNLKQARKKQHRGSEADAQGKDFSDPRLPSSGNFQGTQIQQARTLSSRLIQGQIGERADDIRPDNHPEYNELVQYLADVNNSSQDSRSAELRGDSSHGSMEQRTLNSITGEKYRERSPNDPTERMTSYSRKVDLFGRAMTDTAKDSNSTTTGRAQEDSAERPTVISHSLRGHAQGRNGTPRDFSTLKGPDDVSNRLRTISDMSEITDSNDSDEESGTVNGKESVRAPDAATGMRQDGIVHGLRLNTLQEIRSRITEGLKTRFHESRHLGKISDEAFRILVGACDEKMEITSHSKIGVWDILVKKISRSLITQVIASLALHGSIKFKSANPIVKKFLHYPYALAGILCRRYLGRRVLLGCEVAIEYNLALNSSSHVQWLRLHGDYTLPLLEEVELESQLSYNFIIEREIEAPDTFRAIHPIVQASL
eukprot:jgi/Picre1/32899/NNA_008228.t1